MRNDAMSKAATLPKETRTLGLRSLEMKLCRSTGTSSRFAVDGLVLDKPFNGIAVDLLAGL